MNRDSWNIKNLNIKEDFSNTDEPITLKTVVDKLCNRAENTPYLIKKECRHYSLPSRDVVKNTTEALRSVLFPEYLGTSELTQETMHYYIGSTLDWVFHTLKDQIKRGLCFDCEDQQLVDNCIERDKQALSITKSFFTKLTTIQQQLNHDVKAHYDCDPAAKNAYETLICYPGVLAITNYRIAHELYLLKVPLIPRIITEYAHNITGIDIHPGANIGNSFFIDHGTGVVIGETCIIGNNVRIYQGVTLGAKSFSLDCDGKPVKGVDRHPIVEDNVTIYSGATILGRVKIGRNSVIGGNVWLTHSVPPESNITQVEARDETHQNGSGI
jgi:serine O-acetyltransferase